MADTDPERQKHLDGQFEATMLSHHWIPVRHLDGTVARWERPNQARQIPQKTAYDYWLITGKTPMPF